MISQLAIDLAMFDAYRLDKELDYLTKAEIGLDTLFSAAKEVMFRTNGLRLPEIPTQIIREVVMTSNKIKDRIEYHYWNACSEMTLSCNQYTEQLVESVTHHVRLLYVDLWGLVFQFGIPLQRIQQINRLPYGVFLNVSAA